jgi:hypothetical protein
MFSAISNFHHDCRIMKRTACASGPQGAWRSRVQSREQCQHHARCVVPCQVSAAISRRYRMRSAVRADPATTMAPVVMIAHMATPGGRTCYRPNSRSSTTADRAPDDCAAHRAASRRALRERNPRRELSLPAPGKRTTIESEGSDTPQNVQFLTVARPESSQDYRRSPLPAKRPTILFALLSNATTMSLQSTLFSVRWSRMDVSL